MALAPEQAAIGIRRRFTTEGVHPYDLVEWERRDARITNYRDGSVAFEQTDVEFPVDWSLNATNIVAQKYFRGTLGTPERESSLKQVADRVADTIADWGLRDGYFVDEREADVFRDELKYLIVTQRAAFNSPVWFNIGVKGVPQQGSACQPYDAMVSTPDGMVPIGRLVEDEAVGTKVLDAHGLTKVVAVKANGRKPVLRIHTKAGHRLDVTPDHLVWKSTGSGTGRFVEAGTLQADDQLEWHRVESWGIGEISIEQQAEAALAGWLQADGFVGQYDHGTNRSLTIEAMTVTDAEHEWVSYALDKVFPAVHRKERTVETQRDDLDCRRLRLYGEVLRPFVEKWDLLARREAMQVPAQLFEAPLPVVAAYLRSLFQADGYVSVKDSGAVIGLDMLSDELIHGVQRLLARFGIFSRARFKADRRPDRKGLWSLTIRSLADRVRFGDEISFLDPVKVLKLVESYGLDGKGSGDVKRLEIERIETLGEMDVFDIQTESGEYLCDSLRVHNCFILSVDDTMDSILNWYTEEGTIFKGGSGAGVNLSRIRSSEELLKGGGTASGPVSFMRGADASAGTIKSGGKTRRAAKMVILNVDHPDIEEFIWCKAHEERKARALEAAGFDMSLDGKDITSVQYQNANNSVRVTDEFMQAVVDDTDWHLRAVITGEIIKTVRARDLMRQISQATWECADPGMQFDTTINHWHTACNTGRINGSNPCFPGDAMVHTDKGLVSFVDLIDRTRLGESFGVYTHDATNPDEPAERLEITSPEAVMVTGMNEIVKLRFSNGAELRCTPSHRIFTVNRGYVEACELTEHDQVKTLDLPAPAVAADHRLPVSTDVRDYADRDRRTRQGVELPEKWSGELAHYLGWLVGDGCISGEVATSVYGSDDDREHVLPRHRALLTELNGGREPKPSVQANDTVQLRQGRRAITRFFEALGLSDAKATEKIVPWSINEAPSEMAAAFLRGLFDADGCVRVGEKERYVGLGSSSRDLLLGVQRLLTTFGVFSRIYRTRDASSEEPAFTYVRKDGSVAHYDSKPMFDLRITGRSMERFAEDIGFGVPAKVERLAGVLDGHRRYATKTTVRLVERTDDGVELTYNLSEPRNHSYIVNGLVVRNCSEYMHLDNSACNLASINLLKFLDDDGTFDIEAFEHTVEIFFTGQEIIVGNADYPTEPIGENSRRFRQLGLGYANLGALLMALGLPYDSDAGRAWAGAITALMTGHAYATSARTAARMGPFAGYTENEEHMLRVLDQHREETAKIDEELVPAELLSAAQRSWDDACEIAGEHGVRNSQASVLAPTGCLVGGSLVATDRGLVRLRSLGDPDGAQWQDLDAQVATDDGVREATKFYVNGLESVVDVETSRGYRIQGTTKHRIKVVDPSGEWVWRRFADLRPDDIVPLMLDQIVGDPQEVVLAPLSEKMAWAGEHHVDVPTTMSPELAELVGYFMGDGSLHSRGLRLCVTDGDYDVVDRLEHLAKELFGIQALSGPAKGYIGIELNSVRLAGWWQACGFAKRRPHEGHRGKGYHPHIPDAVLHSNDREIYRAFVRGLFEADGTATDGYPSWTTTCDEFSHDVQSLLLALGFVTTRKYDVSGRGSRLAVLRLLNRSMNQRWLDHIGFLSDRKNAGLHTAEAQQSARYDHIPVTRELIDRVLPDNDRDRKVALMELARSGSITRRLAREVADRTGDAELTHLLGYFFDRITTAELGDEELTYDISVPDNVTYTANGFVSHNTIGLMMDCDTTGVEPDLGLVKLKKLVGGGTMSIVNQTIPRALRNLEYSETEIDQIVAYIDEHKTILGAPNLKQEHLAVFACSMGDNVIHYRGHVKMMGAVQPFISGAISKCVIGETILPTEDGLLRIESLHQGEVPDTFRDEIVRVASLDGEQKTDAFYFGGVRAVRRAVLRSGHRVTGTPNHRLLVAGDTGLDWRRLDELAVGDMVAVKYGANLWSTIPARFDEFEPSPRYGSQKTVRIPQEMSDDLGYLLGAFAAEGHITRSTWTINITNSVPEVRRHLVALWSALFDVTAVEAQSGDRCPQVIVSSKTIVEFLDHLGIGGRASEKRIPDAVLRSPRTSVLAFLQGLSLDAYVSVTHMPKWGICLDAPALLDELQSILTNLGIVHGRISKYNREYDKHYDEVYATGAMAQELCALVPFVEPDKADRAAELCARTFAPNHSTADVVPGIAPRDLYELLPRGERNLDGQLIRTEFAFLCDPRAKQVSRRTLERVWWVPGVTMPDWLDRIVRDDLHLSPVESIGDAGIQPVFDVSVPTTHAFVGNGIVNHNTVNMPEDVSVEDVEQLHIDAWKLGIKAVAIYRDNCKVAQPLAMAKKDDASADAPTQATQVIEKIVEKVIREPVRQKLPRTRASRTFEFRVADCKGFVTVGEYEDGRPGEIFVRVSKQGSTLAGIMDAFAISVSHGLQYGVPLRSFVEAFTGMRFEPAGMTDDEDIRIANSLMDYLFRKLAVLYLSPEERAELNILTTQERMQPTLPGVEETVVETRQGTELPPDPPSIESASTLFEQTGAPSPSAAAVRHSDAPMCMQCGVQMQRAGSCHACPSCGTTSGCS